jgi:hypothetical protein
MTTADHATAVAADAAANKVDAFTEIRASSVPGDCSLAVAAIKAAGVGHVWTVYGSDM